MNTICWLVVFLVLLAIEIATLGLTTIWFAFGAVAALIATIFNAGYVIQMVLFIVVSIISLLVTRPIAVKYFNNNTVKTNVDELVGRKVVVTKEIPDENTYGETEVNGEVWIAATRGEGIKQGEVAEVTGVEGIKLILKKK